jgi:hypothetical protein
LATSYKIEVTGDLRGVITLPKQIEFGTAKTLTDLVKKSQEEVVREFAGGDTGLIIRGDWYLPSRKFGIKVKTASRKTLEARLYSNADWLLELHGYNSGVKRPDKGGKNLAEPNVEFTRHGIKNPISRAEKARRLLDNSSRTKAFKVVSEKTGNTLILQRAGADATTGIAIRGKRGNLLQGRGKDVVKKLFLKYVFRKLVKVPYNPVLFRVTINTHFKYMQAFFSKNLQEAIRTAK